MFISVPLLLMTSQVGFVVEHYFRDMLITAKCYHCFREESFLSDCYGTQVTVNTRCKLKFTCGFNLNRHLSFFLSFFLSLSNEFSFDFATDLEVPLRVTRGSHLDYVTKEIFISLA